jgi:hypothetical protein
MAKHFSFGHNDSRVVLHLSDSPWWCDALIHVSDGICALSRHHLCNSLVVRVYDLTKRHEKAHLAVSVDREHWVEWAKLTGDEDPSWWWEDDEPDDAPNLAKAFANPRRFRQDC